MKRRAFISKLRRRFSLRLHMTMILMATAMSGVVASRLMLMGGITNPAIRYPITVLFAYGVFFIAIKFWLWIIFGAAVAQTGGWDVSVPDIPGTGFKGGSAGKHPGVHGFPAAALRFRRDQWPHRLKKKSEFNGSEVFHAQIS